MNKYTKKNHIGIIVLGAIFISLSLFHTNLWFDESYSVAISKHSFADIWTIGGNDVHPILYYWLLKILNIFFGNNILIYRLFSAIPVVLMGILGYTHIRKDFGEKTGLYFSFLTFFLPINIVYSGEIRMYTWTMLVVTVMSIYAYRIAKNNEMSKKNWIIFGITSLASAYSHYYGLITAGVVNLFLMVYLILQAKKEKKFTKSLTSFIISAITQIILYIPWIVYFVIQLSNVSKGFWIGFNFPGTFLDMFSFQFTGNLGDVIHIPEIVAQIFGLIICVYLIYIICKNKNKEEIKPAKLAFGTYASVLVIAGIISIVIQPILYARYMLVITGLLMFSIACVLDKLGNHFSNLGICILIFVIAIAVNTNLIITNYNKTNKESIQYMKENVQEQDLLIYSNEGSGFVISVNFPNNTQYFYDIQKWNVEKAYKAYGPNMETIYDLSNLKDYKGRIWLINSDNYSLLEEVQREYNVKVLDQKNYDTTYQKYKYTFTLVEK